MRPTCERCSRRPRPPGLSRTRCRSRSIRYATTGPSLSGKLSRYRRGQEVGAMPEVLLAERNGTGGVGRLDIAAARKRLEDVLDELDRSVAVLDGAHQRHPLVADYPQDPADAGTTPAQSYRADAARPAAKAR